MEDDMYKEALIAFNKGEYEEVLEILYIETCLSEKEKVLLRESRKQVTEQYLFLIKEYIRQKEYSKAKVWQEEYISKYNFDDRVADIEIVVNRDASNKEANISNEEVKPKVIRVEVPEKKPVFSNKVLFGFGLVALLGIVSFFIWKSQDAGDYVPVVENRVEEVQQPTSNTSTINTERTDKLNTEKQEDEVTLKRYYNSRFGYRILYPSFFKNIRESDNGDGCRFSKNDNTYLSVSGMYNSLNETLKDKYNEYKVKSPVYCRLKNNWFVVSDYTEDGDIFYLKTVLKNNIFMTAILVFPKDEKEYYSPIIPKMFTKFPN